MDGSRPRNAGREDAAGDLARPRTRGCEVPVGNPSAWKGTREPGIAARTPKGMTQAIAWLDVQWRIRREAERDRWREREDRVRARDRRR